MNERIKVLLWCLLHYPEYKFKSWQTRHLKSRLHIYNSKQTLQAIVSGRLSVARYGDGEFQMIAHLLKGGDSTNFGVDTFQSYDAGLAERLYEVLQTSQDGLLICLPYQLRYPETSDLFNNLFWEREWLSNKDFLAQVALDRQLGDTNFTRFYMGRRDIKDYSAYIALLKQLWAGREVVMVEGEYSRLGVGNDLFASAQSVKRIVCPATNAFVHYEAIRSAVITQVSKDALLLLALGHTATVLAYDLYQLGYQALDVGHVDVEYEWYRMGAKSKVAILGKYVNEVASGRIQTSNNIDEQYQKEIIARIG